MPGRPPKGHKGIPETINPIMILTMSFGIVVGVFGIIVLFMILLQ